MKSQARSENAKKQNHSRGDRIFNGRYSRESSGEECEGKTGFGSIVSFEKTL